MGRVSCARATLPPCTTRSLSLAQSSSFQQRSLSLALLRHDLGCTAQYSSGSSAARSVCDGMSSGPCAARRANVRLIVEVRLTSILFQSRSPRPELLCVRAKQGAHVRRAWQLGRQGLSREGETCVSRGPNSVVVSRPKKVLRRTMVRRSTTPSDGILFFELI